MCVFVCWVRLTLHHQATQQTLNWPSHGSHHPHDNSHGKLHGHCQQDPRPSAHAHLTSGQKRSAGLAGTPRRVITSGATSITRSPSSESARPNLTVLEALGTSMPSQEEIVLDHVFEKLRPDGDWVLRRLLVTSKDIFIARTGDAVIVESVPLASIAALSGPDFDLVRDPDYSQV